MSSESWSDRDLRSFVLRAPWLFRGDEALNESTREAFRREARAQIGPAVQTRVIAEVGALTSLDGIAVLACELLEDGLAPRERDWMLVCADPWRFLEEWVGTSVIRSHRAVAKKAAKDAKTLDGIAAASTRKALGAGEDDPPRN